MEKEVEYTIQKDPLNRRLVVTATFSEQLADVFNKLAIARLAEQIIQEATKRWVDEHYMEIAGRISVDTVVNGVIGQLVVKALDNLGKDRK